MGREIRRVPPNWEHPKYTAENAPSPAMIGEYRACRDETFDDALGKWNEEYQMWKAGTHPNQLNPRFAKWARDEFTEWIGGPPNPLYHRPAFTEEATWFQVYQTVSEGTPVSPPFATKVELVDYLTEMGDFWTQANGDRPPTREQAEAFVNEGFAVSMAVAGGRVFNSYETMTL